MSRNLNFTKGFQAQVLLMEIAQGLSDLQKEPDLAKRIEEAYAMNESKKAELANAEAIINESASLKAALDAREQELSVVNERIKIAEQKEKENQSTLALIKEKEKDLFKAEKQIIAEHSNIDNRARELDKREVSLKNYASELEGKMLALQQYEEKLRLAAEQSKAAFGML